MKKRVIRLTESELKRYINKVVSEQMINKSQPTVDPTKTSVKLGDTTKNTDPWGKIYGVNAQMFLDANKTQKGPIVKVAKVVIKNNNQEVTLYVQDLSKMNTSLGTFRDDKDKGYVRMAFECGDSDFYAQGEPNSNVRGVLYNDMLVNAVSTALYCDRLKMKTDVQFTSSNGGSKPSNQA
jgi:hypothetical protein